MIRQRSRITKFSITVETIDGEETYTFFRPEKVADLSLDEGLIGAIVRREWFEPDGESHRG